jgi:anti-sigma factor RsiW
LLAQAVRDAQAPEESRLAQEASRSFAAVHARLMEDIDLARQDAELVASATSPAEPALESAPWIRDAAALGLSERTQLAVAPQVLTAPGAPSQSPRHSRWNALLNGPWSRRARLGVRYAAAACVLAAGVLGGHTAGRQGEGNELPVQSIVQDYAAGLGAGAPLEVSARSEGDTSRWMSQRMGRPISVPEASRVGAMLLGARSSTVQGRPSAQVHYLKDGVRVAYYQIHAPHLGMAGLGEVRSGGRSYFTQRLGNCSLIAWRTDEDIMAVVSPLAMPDSLSLALSMREATPVLTARPLPPSRTSDG